MINPIIKVIELFVDEEHDAILQSISIVDKPAIEREFMYFSEDGRRMLYFQEVEDQHIVVSPAMIPDKMIARKDDKTGEVYYVYFSADTISKAAEYLMKYNKQSHSNLNHERVYSDDMYVMESWIKESENDKSTNYGFGDLPVGTWFVKFRVLNDNAWSKIKSGELKGLSVEGDFLLGAEKYMSANFSRHKAKYSVVRSKYKRVYKGLSDAEKIQMDELLFLVEMAAQDVYDNPVDAVKRSRQLGLAGEIHSFMDPETKTLMYMPGVNMVAYEEAQAQINPIDIVSMDIPLLQKMLEVAKEAGLSDAQLHKLVENATALSTEGKVLTIDDLPALVAEVTDAEMEIVADLPPFVDEGQGMKKKKMSGTPLSEMEFDSAMEFAKVSFDYDDTLSTPRGFDMAKRYADGGDTLYIISARNTVSEGMLARADKLGIPTSRVFATGSNKAKIEKVKELGISKHIDNNTDVISELPGVGMGFANVEDLKVGNAVSWQTSGSNPRGRIREIVREGSKKVPGADFEIAGTSDNPGYIIELYEQDAEGNWKPTGTMVGRKADSILKNVDFVESQIDIQNSKFRIFLSPIQKQTITKFIDDVKTTYGL